MGCLHWVFIDGLVPFGEVETDFGIFKDRPPLPPNPAGHVGSRSRLLGGGELFDGILSQLLLKFFQFFLF
jgi:hypothetical protein